MAHLSQIETFVEVARAKSFAAAARRLSAPRSTVAARVKALEERLGARLLHRSTRRVALTDEGERYYASCETALTALREAEQAIAPASEPQGVIRLSAPVDFPKPLLSRLLLGFSERHPAVSFVVDIDDKPADLIGENVDVALRGRDPGQVGLVARKIGAHRMVCVRAAGRPAVGPSGRGVLDPARLLTARSAFGVPARIETGNFELAKQLALASDVAALLPAALCVEEIAAGRLEEVDPAMARPDLPLFVVLPSKRLMPARVRAFVDFLVERLTARDAAFFNH